MKHCFGFLLAAICIGTMANAQLVNNGATITVQSGATIKCTGTITNNSGGTIQNAGIISSDGELRNESGGTLTNNGTAGVYEATTKFINNGNAFSGIKLRLIGNANTDSLKSGAGSTYDSVILAKGSGFNVTLSDAMTVNLGILFNNDNNKLILEDENLTMASGAVFQNSDNNQFVVTNNTGTVTKQNLGTTTFMYPVGFSGTEFNPLSITNNGAQVDNFSVRCMQNVQANGTSGAIVTTDFVNNSWVVSEGTAGGSSLTLTGQWVAGDEAGAGTFNRIKSGIARYNTGTDWDLPASNVIAASGSGPYLRTRTGITSTGVFAVADLDKVNTVRLNLKVFLQGPYPTGGTMMNDNLRASNVLPLTQPYSLTMGSVFDRVGVYDGSSTVNEHVQNNSNFDVALAGDDIVDWVYVSLQDGANPATKFQSRAALLQRDGDIVEYDSATATYGFLRMPIDNDVTNYYVLVAHRNHLAIRTPTATLMQDNTTFTYNFTDNQNKAYQNPTAPVSNNTAMRNLGNGSFALWAGNVNPDLNTTVNYTGLNNDALALLGLLGNNQAGNIGGAPTFASTYNRGDLNMNGVVNYTGLNNDALFLLGVLGNNQAGIIRQHL